MQSIGNFAENLILNHVENIGRGKELPPNVNSNTPNVAPAGIDISETKVPDSFMRELLGEQFVPTQKIEEEHPQTTSDLIQQETASEDNKLEILSEETAQKLIPLLEEVTILLREMCASMTSSGNIGTNLGSKTNKVSFDSIEKKLGYKKPMNRKQVLKTLLKDIKRK